MLQYGGLVWAVEVWRGGGQIMSDFGGRAGQLSDWVDVLGCRCLRYNLRPYLGNIFLF